jgi:hypothetical protein
LGSQRINASLQPSLKLPLFKTHFEPNATRFARNYSSLSPPRRGISVNLTDRVSESPRSGRGHLAHGEPAVGRNGKQRVLSPVWGDIRLTFGQPGWHIRIGTSRRRPYGAD